MQDRQLAILTPGQTEYDQDNGQIGQGQPVDATYGGFLGLPSHMRGGLLSAGSASMAHEVGHADHHGFHIFSEASRFEDGGDQFAQHDRNMVHLRDTPNTLLEPSGRRAPEVNAWNVDEI